MADRHAYFFKGADYVRYNIETDLVDVGPVDIARFWTSLPAAFQSDLDAVVNWGDGHAYFFKGADYVRYNIETDLVDVGPVDIARFWTSLPAAFQSDLDAVVNWGDGHAYFFKGADYVRYNIETDLVDVGPVDIARFWTSLPAAFQSDLDAVVNWGDGHAYFFKGADYVRYNIETDLVDVGPVDIARFWTSLPAAFQSDLDAVVNWDQVTETGDTGGGDETTVIEDKFQELLGGGLNLGTRVGGEQSTYDGGRLQRYSGGVIYFHPRLGQPFEVHGAILAEYRRRFEVMSELGYPTSDETNVLGLFGAGRRRSTFESGQITWSARTGAVATVSQPPPFAPQIVVKVREALSLDIGQGNTLSAAELGSLGGPAGGQVAQTLLSILPDIQFHRLFEAVSPDAISVLVAQAVDEVATYEPPNFEHFLEADCPPGFDTSTLVDVLQQFTQVVEYAYVVEDPTDPLAVTPNNDPKFRQQGYLSAAPAGIGAQAAWNKEVDGAGRNVIDLEQGWFFAQEDLPAGISLLHGENSNVSFGHGTAVLGEMVAVDNALGIVGVAPNASAATISYFSRDKFNSAASRKRIAEGVMQAGVVLAPGRDADGNFGHGGVLLIEAQLAETFGGVRRAAPVEVDRAIFEAIRLLTAARVIVVEAAGNGDGRLDDFRDANGKRVMARGTPDFRDSGAIMVAGAMAAVPHVKLNQATSQPKISTNFGSRIDCYAWGEQIVTTGWNPAAPDARDRYWEQSSGFFGGTSGASPIIAGACLLLQGLQATLVPKSGIAGALSPAQVRQVLSKTANGTGSTDAIGVMPDFAKIIANEFVPD